MASDNEKLQICYVELKKHMFIKYLKLCVVF